MDRDKTGEVIVTKADEDAIREIELRFNEAWGRHDADGMVESLVDDAQFVTVNGAWTTTRNDFRDLMRRLHGANGPFRSSRRETPEMHVRFLAPDVAIVHSRFHIYGDIEESERTSIGTRVVRKLDGRWRTVGQARRPEQRAAAPAGLLLVSNGHTGRVRANSSRMLQDCS
jgi:uncharacterized protein (TIGR02246 family)